MIFQSLFQEGDTLKKVILAAQERLAVFGTGESDTPASFEKENCTVVAPGGFGSWTIL